MQNNNGSVNTDSLIEAALSYARMGIRVFPLQPQSKIPYEGWMWKEHASRDPNLIRQWWGQAPESNIALVMGKDSGVMALDVDNKHGKDGAKSAQELGIEPSAAVQRTPSGGTHILWRHRDGLSNFTNRGPHGGLDMRTDNGYILGAPSKLPEGQYQWVNGSWDLDPIPNGIYETLSTWTTSRPTVEESNLPFPVEITPQYLESVYAALPQRIEDFLRDGVNVRGDGDDSHELFYATLGLLKMSLSPEIVLSILSHTYALTVAERHRGRGEESNLEWLWKYTVLSAAGVLERERLQVEQAVGLAKESPGAGGPTGQNGVPTKQKEMSTPTAPLDPKQILVSRAQILDAKDPESGLQLIADLVEANLGPWHTEVVIEEIRKATGMPKTVLNEELSRGRKAQQRARVKKDDSAPLVFVQDQDKYLYTRSRVMISERALLTEKAREYDGDRLEAARDWATGARARIPTVVTQTFDPSLEPGITTNWHGDAIFNRYVKTPLVPRKGDPGPWLDLIESMDWESPEVTVPYLLDWFAYQVQHPEDKSCQGVLLGGDFGIGKDTMLDPIIHAVGPQNVKQPEGSELLSDFSEFLVDAKLLVVNETRHSGVQPVYEKLKSLTASPPDFLRVNEKNVKRYPIPNLVGVVLTSNHRDALALEIGDRRWFCAWAQRKGVQGDRAWINYFNQLWDWLRNGGREIVFNFLLERSLVGYEPKGAPPITPWKDLLVDAEEDPLAYWLNHQRSRRIPPFASEVIEDQMLREFCYAAADSSSNGIKKGIRPRDITYAASKLGWIRVTKRAWRGRQRIYLWVFDPKNAPWWEGLESWEIELIFGAGPSQKSRALAGGVAVMPLPGRGSTT